MPTVEFDCNIFDLLDADVPARERIAELVEHGEMTVLVPTTLREELQASPFGGVPEWFPYKQVPDSVFALGHSCLGEARLGSGDVYDAHKGTSHQVPDAVIADLAETESDYFVSEDKRACRRLAQIARRCQVMSYLEFRLVVLKLQPKP